MAKNNRTSRLTADEKTLLEEYRKSGLTPEDIKALKLQTDEKYIHVLAYRYWIACAKLHNANELLHGNCRCCIHWNALEQEKCPAAPATTWSVQMRRSMAGNVCGTFQRRQTDCWKSTMCIGGVPWNSSSTYNGGQVPYHGTLLGTMIAEQTLGRTPDPKEGYHA